MALQSYSKEKLLVRYSQIYKIHPNQTTSESRNHSKAWQSHLHVVRVIKSRTESVNTTNYIKKWGNFRLR